MRLIIAAAVIFRAWSAPAFAQSMPLETFVQKGNALKKKGPLALFSGDLKLLQQEMGRTANALRAERLAAAKAGKTPAYCPPDSGVKLDAKDILTSFNAIPAAQRARMTSKDGFRQYMARKFPCRR